MKKIFNYLLYGKHDKKTFYNIKSIINNNNYKRLILFCFICFFVNAFFLFLSSFLKNEILTDGAHIYLIMIVLSLGYLIALSLFNNKSKKYITFFFYIFVLINLYCYETLDINYNLNSTISLICIVYMISSIMLLDIPFRYSIITLIFTIWLCLDTINLKNSVYAFLDCVNCIICYIISACFSYYYFNERLENTKILKKVIKQRDTDYLTGIGNRIFFEKKISNFFKYNLIKSCVIFFVDIDNLKFINDTYGHDKGDSAIKKVAKIITKCFRSNDWISRIGGDEFAIFIPNNLEQQKIDEKLTLLRERTNQITIDENVRITCSIGVSISEEGDTCESLLKKADANMYKNKKHAIKKE